MYRELKIIIILMCLLLLPINALAVSYGKTGESTNFDGDVGVPSGYAYYINGILLSIDDITTTNLIVEADLKSVNEPVDEYILTYESTDGDFEWHTKGELGIASSGANTDITSIYNTSLKFGRDADNLIDFTTDNKIVFRISAADKIEMISTGELDMNAGSVGFTLQTATGDGSTTIDWRLGNKFKFTFGSQNDTLTFINPTNPCTLMLTIIQDAEGSRTITWDGDQKWAGGVEPTLTTTANARDKIALDWDGTQYDCVVSLDFK